MKLTPDIIRSIHYFHDNKSVESFCDWEEVKAEFAKTYPDIYQAMQAVKINQAYADQTLKNLVDELPEEDLELK